MPYLYNRKKWTGWDLNPRPQQRMLVVDAIEFSDYRALSLLIQDSILQ